MHRTTIPGTTRATDHDDASQHELDQVYGQYPLPLPGQGTPEPMGGER